MNERDEGFEQRVRTTLNESVTALDADTRNRLAAGRAHALSHTSRLARWMPTNTWIPVTAFAACAVLAVTLFIERPQSDTPLHLAQNDEEFALDLLLSDDDIRDMNLDSYMQMEAILLVEEEDAQDAS